MRKSKDMARAYLLSESLRILNCGRGDGAPNGGQGEIADNEHLPHAVGDHTEDAGLLVVNREQGQNVND